MGKSSSDPVKDLIRRFVVSDGTRPSYVAKDKKPLPDVITRRKQLENAAFEQDIKLKKQTLDRLFLLLSIETAVVFLLAVCQACKFPFDFSLDEWSFRLVVTATITQITLMLNIAVKHLFPYKKDSIEATKDKKQAS